MISIPLYIVSDTRATINNRSSYMPHDQIFRGRSPPASSVYSELDSNFTTSETGDLRTRSTKKSPCHVGLHGTPSCCSGGDVGGRRAHPGDFGIRPNGSAGTGPGSAVAIPRPRVCPGGDTSTTPLLFGGTAGFLLESRGPGFAMTPCVASC